MDCHQGHTLPSPGACPAAWKRALTTLPFSASASSAFSAPAFFTPLVASMSETSCNGGEGSFMCRTLRECRGLTAHSVAFAFLCTAVPTPAPSRTCTLYGRLVLSRRPSTKPSAAMSALLDSELLLEVESLAPLLNDPDIGAM